MSSSHKWGEKIEINMDETRRDNSQLDFASQPIAQRTAPEYPFYDRAIRNL